jgi:hypothetical protein
LEAATEAVAVAEAIVRETVGVIDPIEAVTVAGSRTFSNWKEFNAVAVAVATAARDAAYGLVKTAQVEIV